MHNVLNVISASYAAIRPNSLILSEKCSWKQTKIAAFDFAGFDKQHSTSLCQLHQPFNGHDLNVLAQAAMFVLWANLYILMKEFSG